MGTVPGGARGKPVQKLEGEREDRNVRGDGPQTEGRGLRPAPARAQRPRTAASRWGPSQPITAPQTLHLPAPPHSAPWELVPLSIARRAVLLQAQLLPLPHGKPPTPAPGTPPSWHHVRGGHHQHTAGPGPMATQAHACGRHRGGPEIRGLGSTCVSSGGCIAPGDVGLHIITAPWSPPQVGRSRCCGPLCRLGDGDALVPSTGRETEAPWSPLQVRRWRRRGPLCRLGDGGAMVPSAGREMEGPWSPPQAGRWRRWTRASPGLPLHSAPSPPCPKQMPGTL